MSLQQKLATLKKNNYTKRLLIERSLAVKLLIKNNNQKLAVKGKKLKNLADLYTVEFYRGSLLPISCTISEFDKLFVQRRTIRQTETDE